MKPLIAICLCLMCLCAVFCDPVVVDAKIQYQYDNSNFVAAVDQEAAVPAYNSADASTDVVSSQNQLIIDNYYDSEAAVPAYNSADASTDDVLSQNLLIVNNYYDSEAAVSANEDVACCRPLRRLWDAAPLRRGLRWLLWG